MAKVLVVDDDTALRELLYDALSRTGHEVLTASSIAHALELMKTQRAQVILLDSAMVGESHRETVSKLRDVDDTVPVLLLQGAGEPDVPKAELERVGTTTVLKQEAGGNESFLNAVGRAVNEAQERRAAGSKGPGMRVPCRLLVVDDDPAGRKMLQLLFEKRGFQVILAGSGEEALKALAQKPHAALLDINMPGMDGLLTLKKLKASNPNLLVIVVSGAGENEIVREALKSGAYDYVAKPFNVEYLETVVLTKVFLGTEG